MNRKNNVSFGIGMAILCSMFVFGVLWLFTHWGDKTILRERTTALIAVCANMLLVQHFRSRLMSEALRGVVLATVGLAALWLLFYGTEILAEMH